MDLAPDFNEFFELLHAHRIEYVVVQLHVMSAIDGVTWEQVWDGHEVAVLGGQPIPFIGRQAFLQNKRAAGRAKDLADIEALGGEPTD